MMCSSVLSFLRSPPVYFHRLINFASICIATDQPVSRVVSIISKNVAVYRILWRTYRARGGKHDTVGVCRRIGQRGGLTRAVPSPKLAPWPAHGVCDRRGCRSVGEHARQNQKKEAETGPRTTRWVGPRRTYGLAEKHVTVTTMVLVAATITRYVRSERSTDERVAVLNTTTTVCRRFGGADAR